MREVVEKLKLYLTDNKLLDDLSVAAAQMDLSCWLVGGVLRDGLLGRPITDIDLVTIGDPTLLAQQWAKEQDGHWFWLDQGRRQSRVLLRSQEGDLCFDFAPLRAATLEQDLSLRDFTINAMALPLTMPLSEQELFDPLRGKDDLLGSRLRACSEQSLKEDPLRILKGIRHSVVLGFQIDSVTEAQMYDLAEDLQTTAGERKRSELGRILACGKLKQALTLFDRCRLFPVLFGSAGEKFYISEVVSELGDLLATMDEWSVRAPLVKQMSVDFDEEFNRRTLFLLALLLRHYRCSELAQVLTDNLRFSRRAIATIESLVFLDYDRFSMLAELPDSIRAKCLWLESLGSTCIDQLLFFAAVHQPVYLRPQVMQQLLHDYTDSLVYGRIPDLLNGSEIMQLLPGMKDKQIGSYQKLIKQAEITGEIASKEDAREFLLSENSIDKN